ncbi:MAG: PDZ domain-containing protein [Armatimonadetes bacterium]|nr:MAG: PDZ domain-containing protein [Armatimonadota bacterium]
MENDTPNPGSEESQVPFMSQRNPEEPPDVQIDMSDTTPTQEHPASSGSHVFDSPLPPPPPPPPPAEEHRPTVAAPVDPIVPVSSRIGATQPPKRRNGLAYIAIAFAAAIVGALLTVGILGTTGAFDTDPITTATTATPSTVVNQPATVIETDPILVDPAAIAKTVLPSVVTVNVFGEGSSSAPEDRIPTGSGSGVVTSADGYIITNHHVIAGASSYAVTFEDGRTYEAELIGSDALTDLAVLQISADDLTPIGFGSTDGLAIGDPAVAVGNPLGQQGGSSITVGIISAFDRRVDFADTTTLFGMIQTDAAINSGSSGGALVDASGNLIGITSAIGVSNAGPEGIGYAIPVDIVQRITSEIIETGDVEHPLIGVEIATYFDEASDGAIVPAGAIVETVEATNSAARDAGIEVGDVVVGIGDTAIKSQSDLINAVRHYRVGDVVVFTVIRGGNSLDFEITMGQRPPELQG